MAEANTYILATIRTEEAFLQLASGQHPFAPEHTVLSQYSACLSYEPIVESRVDPRDSRVVRRSVTLMSVYCGYSKN